MQAISEVLRWVFTYIFYPIVVIGIFIYVVGVIVFLVNEARGLSAVRRMTAAVLPLLFLIFVVLSTDESSKSVREFFLSINPIALLALGAVVGIAMVELGRRLLRSDTEIGPSVYALFLSSVGVFILYSIMQGILASLHFFLFGMLLVGGLDIVFKGPPQIAPERKLEAQDSRADQADYLGAYSHERSSERSSRAASTKKP
jgi:hypothetical protein